MGLSRDKTIRRTRTWLPRRRVALNKSATSQKGGRKVRKSVCRDFLQRLRSLSASLFVCLACFFARFGILRGEDNENQKLARSATKGGFEKPQPPDCTLQPRNTTAQRRLQREGLTDARSCLHLAHAGLFRPRLTLRSFLRKSVVQSANFSFAFHFALTRFSLRIPSPCSTFFWLLRFHSDFSAICFLRSSSRSASKS